MKKLLAIIGAVALAFLIALGDQIVRLKLWNDGFALEGVKKIFGLSDEEAEMIIPLKPRLPQITPQKEEELNLTYDEHIKKGDYYAERGFLRYAVNEYVKAATREPDKSEPYLKLTRTYFDLGVYDKAQKNAEKVLSFTPDNLDMKYLLVKIAVKKNDLAGAEQLLSQNEGLTANDPRFIYQKALIDIALNKPEEATALLKDLSAKPEIDENLKKNAQTLLAGFEEFEFAQAAEKLYLSELLARALNQTGEYELAVYALKDILKNRPDLRDSWIMLGFAYLNLEKYIFALTAFEQAYQLDSEWPATQYFLGIAYAELKQYENAIVYLNYALNNGFEPRVVIKQKLADLYLETQQYEESVKAYEEVLQTNKQDVSAFVRPIWLYLDFLHSPEKALKLGEMAVISFPSAAMAYNLLGWSQMGTENTVEAEKNLKKAIEMDPSLPASHYNLAKLYENQKQKDLALSYYQKAYELDQNGSIGNLAAKRYNALLIGSTP